MPNWVTTRIKFNGNSMNIENVLNQIGNKLGSSNDEKIIDFNKIIPMPENIYQGNLGQKERELYGSDNWYDWSIANWGTKWNACDASLGDNNELWFNTAWNCPQPIIEKLAKICADNDVNFEGEWCNEDWASDSGSFEAVDGNLSIFFDETTEESKKRCRTILGWDPEGDDDYDNCDEYGDSND